MDSELRRGRSEGLGGGERKGFGGLLLLNGLERRRSHLLIPTHGHITVPPPRFFLFHQRNTSFRGPILLFPPLVHLQLQNPSLHLRQQPNCSHQDRPSLIRLLTLRADGSVELDGFEEATLSDETGVSEVAKDVDGSGGEGTRRMETDVGEGVRLELGVGEGEKLLEWDRKGLG
jgi:hypothetical protein